MRTILIILLASTISSCTAQKQVNSTFTSFNMSTQNQLDYINWYNETMSENTKTDTVSLLEIPANSDLAYIHIRPVTGSVTIKLAGGVEIDIDNNYIYPKTAYFNNQNQIIQSIPAMKVVGTLFEVKFERCFCQVIKSTTKL